MSPSDRRGVFISYARADGEKFAAELRKRLEKEAPDLGVVWQDRAQLEGGVGWWKQITDAIDRSTFMALVMTPTAMQSEVVRKEWRYARQHGVCVYPVKAAGNLDFDSIPRWMSKAHFFDPDKEWPSFLQHLRSPCQATRVPFMAPDLPEGFVERPKEFEQLRGHLLDEDRENPVAITTALSGAGGFGKTTLATALCHNGNIQTAFDDGILWVTLGEKPNILTSLTEVYAALTGERPGFVSEADAAHHLSQKLEDKNCLVVIDDVWDGTHLPPFLRGAKGCACLITTRNSEIAVGTRQVLVDEMTDTESVQMLAAAVESSNGVGLGQLADRLGNWPLMLDLARATLAQRMDQGDTLEGALAYVDLALNEKGVGFFRNMKADERHQNVSNTLRLSIDLLEPDDRRRYLELAVFPEDTDVPLSALRSLWQLDEFDTEELSQRLHKLSLLRFNLQTGTIRLHDVIRSWLAEQVSDPARLHQRLVDAWSDRCNLPDDYAWHWLSYHLKGGGRSGDLRNLLLDFDWLRAKLDAADVQALITDYDYLPEDSDLSLVQSALRLSAHILYKEPAQLGPQLIGRLLAADSEPVQQFLTHIRQSQPTPWLESLLPTLSQAGGPLLRTLEGHTYGVEAVAVSADGRHVVSGSADETVKVWELGTGRELRTLEGHTGWVEAVAVTADGRHVVSGSFDNTVKVWELESGRELRTLEGHANEVWAVAVSADGRHVVSGSVDKTVKVWELETGRELRTLEGHSSGVIAVAVSADGRHVVSGSSDNTVKVWELGTGRELRTLKGHADAVEEVAVSADGRHVVSGSSDHTVKVWELGTGRELRTLEGHTSYVEAVAVSADGQHVVSGSLDNTVKVWELETGRELRTLEGHANEVWAVAVSADGRHVVSGSRDNTVKVWELGTGRELRTLEGHTGWVEAVAVSADGRHVVSGSWDKTVKVWELETGRELRTLKGHAERVQAVAVSADGQHVVSGSLDNTVKVWELGTGREVRTLKGHADAVQAVAVSADGRHVVSGSDDNTVKVWELGTGREVCSLVADAVVCSCAVAPDGISIVAGDEAGRIHFLRFHSGAAATSQACG